MAVEKSKQYFQKLFFLALLTLPLSSTIILSFFEFYLEKLVRKT